MNKKLSLCIDIGGTHIVAAVIDKESMTLHNNAMKHVDVDSNADRESVLNDWKIAIAQVLDLSD